MIGYNATNVNDALPVLLGDLLKLGDEVGSRLGERTMELTQIGITLTKPWQRELVLPERKASIAAQIAETMWVLAGRTDIGWLSHYLSRASDFSDDGQVWRAGYGARLRNFGGDHGGPADKVIGQVGVDQIAYIVDLLQRSPGSRQAVATIWDPTVDTEPGKDIACNNWLHFLARRGKLDLLVAIRSNDAMWGWSGINAFEWSALQEIVAGMIGHEVGTLNFAVGSFHLYDRHWEKARRLSETEGNYMYDDSPRFNATGMDDMASFDYCADEWFRVEEEIRTGLDPRLAVESFPEPMLQSWLRVLQWYWTGDVSYLQPLRHTRLYAACQVATKPAGEPQARSTEELFLERAQQVEDISNLPPLVQMPSFLDHVNALHAEKHAAYGDSWKRRGEHGILGNIARKVDRLESGTDTTDETQTDTAIDLLVYLAKYRCWLAGHEGGPEEVESVLAGIQGSYSGNVKHIIEEFTLLEKTIMERLGSPLPIVDLLLGLAHELARARWSK